MKIRNLQAKKATADREIIRQLKAELKVKTEALERIGVETDDMTALQISQEALKGDEG